jgi:PPOX class probable F420-dependent enzyme
MAGILQEFADLLHTTALAHIATIGPKGEPQCTPVWFDWDGNTLRFSQTKTRQKFRNLQRDPRIALSMVDPNKRQFSVLMGHLLWHRVHFHPSHAAHQRL